MEENQLLRSLNPKLNQYVGQMQAEVGNSGKTLHQVLSEYLSLKAENQNLVSEVEDLEVSGAEHLTPQQFKNNCERLERIQSFKDKALEGLTALEEHPWFAFGHSDHRSEEFEPLLRTMRYAFIQLSKFRVEVQSFPLFLNNLEKVSLQEIEFFLQWLKLSPAWEDLIRESRLIPILTRAEDRKLLLEFVRNVKCVRALSQKAAQNQSSESLEPSRIEKSFASLGEGAALVGRYQLNSCVRSELEAKISSQDLLLKQTQSTRRFFQVLSERLGLPEVRSAFEASQVFLLKSCILKIPKNVLPWRLSQILPASQLIRLQGLQNRARPILDARKKLESQFQLKRCKDSEKLRKLASELTTGGLFRSFSTSYKDAVEKYKGLLSEGADLKARSKDTALQMAEGLNEVAHYLDLLHAFENNNDVQKTFGSFFKGIDTDFTLAIEANRCAAQIRTDFNVEHSAVGGLLADFVLSASEEDLNESVSFLSGKDAQSLQDLLGYSALKECTDFLALEEKISLELKDLTHLLSLISGLGIQPGLPLSSLGGLREVNEEIIFLISQIEVNANLKLWLKGHYAGINTDLSLIERGVEYIHFIEEAGIPVELKRALLNAHGPQRFGEHRSFVEPTLASLKFLNEFLVKLEIATHGQTRLIVKIPVPKILAQFQSAFKQSDLLSGWIDYLNSLQEAKLNGLGGIVEFFSTRSWSGQQLLTAYQLAVNASLLKSMIEKTPDKKNSDHADQLDH